MISIVLINWNGKQFLQGCLQAIEDQTYRECEVVIIDNHSTDGSQTFLRQYAGQYRLFLNQENSGYCGGANQGIRATTGAYVLLLNPDVILHEAFLERLLTSFEADPQVGIATGKILRFDRATLDSTGQFLRKNLTPLERGYGEPDTGQYDRPEYVFSACGAVVCYRRAMLADIQVDGAYFDDAYFSFYEDLDIGWRAQLLGWNAYYEPTALAYHYRGGGLADYRQRQHWLARLPFLPSVSFTQKPASIQRHIIKNRYLTLLKNATGRDILTGLPAILKYEMLLWGYVLCVRPSLFTTLFELFKLVPGTLKKRQYIQQHREERQGRV